MSACETGSLEQIYYRPSRPCCENCGAIVRDVKTRAPEKTICKLLRVIYICKLR